MTPFIRTRRLGNDILPIVLLYDEVERMNRPVRNFTFSRLEAGLADLKKNVVDSNPLMQNMIEEFQLWAQSTNIALISEQEPLPFIVTLPLAAVNDPTTVSKKTGQ